MANPSDNYDVPQLFHDCDVKILKSSLNVNHCLYHLYPDKRHHVRLRPRGHNIALPLNAGCRVAETHSFIVCICYLTTGSQVIEKMRLYFL